MKLNIAVAAIATMLALSTLTQARASEGHDGHKSAAVKKEQMPWGIPGDAKAAKRTIAITMSDNMRFTPDRLQVKRGETVKLVVTNGGQVLHELVIGTKKAFDEHAAMMAKHAGMEHDDPDKIQVAPGKTGELVWKFNRAGEFDFACLVPGHYEAGMVGKIKVAAK